MKLRVILLLRRDKRWRKTYVELSAMGDFYLKTVKNCKYLPRRTTNIPVSEKEIPSSTITERPQELDDMLSFIKRFSICK